VVEALRWNLQGLASFSARAGLLLLVWPAVAGYWEWLFCQRKGVCGRVGYRPYLVSAALVGLLALAAYGLARVL
jgi:hypothetical protein